MQETKNAALIKYKKIFNLKRFLDKMKFLFKFWIILAVIIALAAAGYSSFKMVYTGEISSVVNFNFDGIESGLDPRGNKFDVNEIKSSDIVSESIEELGYDGMDPEVIRNSIFIESIVPQDVIDNIVEYSPLIENGEFVSSKTVRDTSYYPTQYKVGLRCEDIGINKKEAADILNKITEKYNNVFYKSYGYNAFVETAVISTDYKNYDYIDAVNVFKASLSSLKEYISELSEKDSKHFRSESGYTFADISASVDAVCDENLDQASSFILRYNVTKDKKTLIAKYKYNIEENERKKASADETIKTIDETLENYEKSSVLVMGNSGGNSGTSVNKTTDSYNYLIQQKLSAQTSRSLCEQEIRMYSERISSLESGNPSPSDLEIAEKQLEQISDKIDKLLEITKETASEYYEKELLNNAFTVLSPANSSMYVMIKTAVIGSERNIISYELILSAVYVFVSAFLCFIKIPEKNNTNKFNKAGKKEK